MAPVDLVKGSVPFYILDGDLLLALDQKDLTLNAVFKGVSDDLSVLLG
jgi:hypothetical protein